MVVKLSNSIKGLELQCPMLEVGWRSEVNGVKAEQCQSSVRMTSDATGVEDSVLALMLCPHCRDQLSSDFWGGTNRVGEEWSREVLDF